MADEPAAKPLTLKEATELDKRLRSGAKKIHADIQQLRVRVAKAKQGQIHVVLSGYKSWPAYLADVFENCFHLSDKEERRDIVEWLSGEDLSSRAIAEIIGVSAATVIRDRKKAGVANATPGKSTAGLDGKIYPGTPRDKVNIRVRTKPEDPNKEPQQLNLNPPPATTTKPLPVQRSAANAAIRYLKDAAAHVETLEKRARQNGQDDVADKLMRARKAVAGG